MEIRLPVVTGTDWGCFAGYLFLVQEEEDTEVKKLRLHDFFYICGLKLSFTFVWFWF